MASEAMMLCKNGKRAYTRGWASAWRVKRATNKKARRYAREHIRNHDGEEMRRVIKGWVW